MHVFFEMWEKKIHLVVIVYEIYMKANRRYMGEFFISTESYRTSVTAYKAARLDLLTSQPTFCKGRKGEEKW